MTKTVETKSRIIKAGGPKGEAVVALLTEDPNLTRQQLAAEIGCTVGRVGEVIRFFRDHGTKEQQALVAKHIKAQPVKTKPVTLAGASTPEATKRVLKATAKKAAPKAKPAAS